MVGAVEDERLHLGAARWGTTSSGADDGAGGQLAQLVDGGLAGEDAQQRFRAAPAGGDGVRAHGHLDQGGGHPFTGGAVHPVMLVLAVQVTFDPAQRFGHGGATDRIQVKSPDTVPSKLV